MLDRLLLIAVWVRYCPDDIGYRNCGNGITDKRIEPTNAEAKDKPQKTQYF